MRLGWMTGPSFLTERLQLHQQSSSLHTSNLSQVVTLQLLEEWGREGWATHVARVSNFYREKRDTFVALARKHLTGLAEWNEPDAGMFVWFRILNPSVKDSEDLIKRKAVEKKVLFVPGKAFAPDNRPSQYVRASFSSASPEQMDEALKRFAELLKECEQDEERIQVSS